MDIMITVTSIARAPVLSLVLSIIPAACSRNTTVMTITVKLAHKHNLGHRHHGKQPGKLVKRTNWLQLQDQSIFTCYFGEAAAGVGRGVNWICTTTTT